MDGIDGEKLIVVHTHFYAENPRARRFARTILIVTIVSLYLERNYKRADMINRSRDLTRI